MATNRLHTRVEVRYPGARGRIRLRGDREPLSWKDEPLEPTAVQGDRHLFDVELPDGSLLEFKPLLEERWSCGRNYTIQSGATLVVDPHFERTFGRLESDLQSLHSPELGRDVKFRVFLPPSYDELEEKRFPVLYAQDGQSLFTDHPDPIDGRSWRMDDALNELCELDAMEEIVVVAVWTDVDRLEMLSPTRDKTYGGGDGPRYRDFLADRLKPVIDTRYRTKPGRATTALIGSSMGGLFSFFAAWTRSNVFGRAACLSSSFWWDDRAMTREVEKGSCPLPRPFLYLDSGAAKSGFTEDANLRDGYHHTMALRHALVSHCYVPGESLETLAFAGLSHDSASWASRLAIPLQVLFPKR